MRIRRALLVPLLLWLCAWSATAAAHEIRPAIATVQFTADGQVQVDLSVNMEAVLAGVSPVHRDTDDSPAAQTYNQLRALPPPALAARIREFEARYLAGIRLEFDRQPVSARIVAIDVPAAGDLARARLSSIRLSGAVPPGAKEFRWAYAADFGQSIVRLPAVDGGEVVALWLKDGRVSDPYVLGVGLQPPSRAQVAAQYTALGFTHILPFGLDHILFVLGLFLLSLHWRPLLVQVTAFTVAHTITLALSIYGVVSLAPAIVEPLIAASIVYVAVENILTARLHAWRPFVVFGFGLLHGMGFAGVLEEIGLPRGEFLTALLTFNLGVELGQLAVITLAFLALGVWFKDRPWYRARIVIPLSALIALTGLYWTVERVFF